MATTPREAATGNTSGWTGSRSAGEVFGHSIVNSSTSSAAFPSLSEESTSAYPNFVKASANDSQSTQVQPLHAQLAAAATKRARERERESAEAQGLLDDEEKHFLKKVAQAAANADDEDDEMAVTQFLNARNSNASEHFVNIAERTVADARAALAAAHGRVEKRDLRKKRMRLGLLPVKAVPRAAKDKEERVQELGVNNDLQMNSDTTERAEDASAKKEAVVKVQVNSHNSTSVPSPPLLVAGYADSESESESEGAHGEEGGIVAKNETASRAR